MCHETTRRATTHFTWTCEPESNSGSTRVNNPKFDPAQEVEPGYGGAKQDPRVKKMAER